MNLDIDYLKNEIEEKESKIKLNETAQLNLELIIFFKTILLNNKGFLFF